MKKMVLSLAAALAILASPMIPAVHAADKDKADSGYTTSPSAGTTDMSRDRDMNRERDTSRDRNASRERSDMDKEWLEAHQVGKLTGAEVKNRQGEDLGKIKDFVIDSRGRIQFALLSEGGVMGVGGKMLAVPFEALSYNPKETRGNYFTLNMSKDQLAKAPEFDETRLSDRTWNERVYRYFGVQPRWNEGMSRQKHEGMSKDRTYKEKRTESGSQYGSQTGAAETK